MTETTKYIIEELNPRHRIPTHSGCATLHRSPSASHSKTLLQCVDLEPSYSMISVLLHSNIFELIYMAMLLCSMLLVPSATGTEPDPTSLPICLEGVNILKVNMADSTTKVEAQSVLESANSKSEVVKDDAVFLSDPVFRPYIDGLYYQLTKPSKPNQQESDEVDVTVKYTMNCVMPKDDNSQPTYYSMTELKSKYATDCPELVKKLQRSCGPAWIFARYTNVMRASEIISLVETMNHRLIAPAAEMKIYTGMYIYPSKMHWNTAEYLVETSVNTSVLIEELITTLDDISEHGSSAKVKTRLRNYMIEKTLLENPVDVSQHFHGKGWSIPIKVQSHGHAILFAVPQNTNGRISISTPSVNLVAESQPWDYIFWAAHLLTVDLNNMIDAHIDLNVFFFDQDEVLIMQSQKSLNYAASMFKSRKQSSATYKYQAEKLFQFQIPQISKSFIMEISFDSKIALFDVMIVASTSNRCPINKNVLHAISPKGGEGVQLEKLEQPRLSNEPITLGLVHHPAFYAYKDAFSLVLNLLNENSQSQTEKTLIPIELLTNTDCQPPIRSADEHNVLTLTTAVQKPSTSCPIVDHPEFCNVSWLVTETKPIDDLQFDGRNVNVFPDKIQNPQYPLTVSAGVYFDVKNRVLINYESVSSDGGSDVPRPLDLLFDLAFNMGKNNLRLLDMHTRLGIVVVDSNKPPTFPSSDATSGPFSSDSEWIIHPSESTLTIFKEDVMTITTASAKKTDTAGQFLLSVQTPFQSIRGDHLDFLVLGGYAISDIASPTAHHLLLTVFFLDRFDHLIAHTREIRKIKTVPLDTKSTYGSSYASFSFTMHIISNAQKIRLILEESVMPHTNNHILLRTLHNVVCVAYGKGNGSSITGGAIAFSIIALLMVLCGIAWYVHSLYARRKEASRASNYNNYMELEELGALNEQGNMMSNLSL